MYILLIVFHEFLSEIFKLIIGERKKGIPFCVVCFDEINRNLNMEVHYNDIDNFINITTFELY